MTEDALLSVEGVGKRFVVNSGMWGEKAIVHAVRGVSLTVRQGETLGIVGESGCGKSTLARIIVRLTQPDEGVIRLAGTDITHLSQRALIPHRRQMQMVFQDPYGSLDPRMRAGAIVAEPLVAHGILSGSALEHRVADLFRRVGLRPDQLRNYPVQFSGGQRQRVAIARALALNPRIIVADEPVSALDVSVQAQVVNLLVDLQAELGLAYVFIAHDLGIVRHVSDRVAVMYLGGVVESGPTQALFEAPRHPYTRLLIESIPVPTPRTRTAPVLTGEVPSPLAPPTGCVFHPRCPIATNRCKVEQPALRQLRGGTIAACHHAA